MLKIEQEARLEQGRKYVQCGIERIIAVVAGSEEAAKLLWDHLALFPDHRNTTIGDLLLNFDMYTKGFRYNEVAPSEFNNKKE